MLSTIIGHPKLNGGSLTASLEQCRRENMVMSVERKARMTKRYMNSMDVEIYDSVLVKK